MWAGGKLSFYFYDLWINSNYIFNVRNWEMMKKIVMMKVIVSSIKNWCQLIPTEMPDLEKPAS